MNTTDREIVLWKRQKLGQNEHCRLTPRLLTALDAPKKTFQDHMADVSTL